MHENTKGVHESKNVKKHWLSRMKLQFRQGTGYGR